jgi:hypothetical protein
VHQSGTSGAVKNGLTFPGQFPSLARPLIPMEDGAMKTKYLSMVSCGFPVQYEKNQENTHLRMVMPGNE